MVHYPPAGKTRMDFPQISLGPSAFLGGPDQWQWLSTGDKFIGRRGEDGPMVLQDQYVKVKQPHQLINNMIIQVPSGND